MDGPDSPSLSSRRSADESQDFLQIDLVDVKFLHGSGNRFTCLYYQPHRE